MDRALMMANAHVGCGIALLAAGAMLAGCSEPRSGRPAPVAVYDAHTTNVARVLAGLRPLDSAAFAPMTARPEWAAWETESHDRWAEAWSTQVQPAKDWAASIASATAGCRTLLAPFSGTNFLSAYALFPSCESYLLVGSDPIGQLPALDGASAPELTQLIEDVRELFPDVFRHGGPRTGAAAAARMPRLAGAVPSLIVQLARLDARIVSAVRFDITSQGRPLESIPIRGGSARHAALNLTFEVPNGQPQSLVYFPADIDDAAVKRKPGTWTFLRLQAPFVTLLLPRPSLPASRCSLLARLITEQSSVILQPRPAWTVVGGPAWTVSELAPLPAPGPRQSPGPILAVKK